MKSFSLFTFTLLLFIAFCQLPTTIFAQVGLSASDISVSISPENPGAHQQTTVSIQSFAADLNAATITWYVNGKKVSSGKGIKQISLTTGSIGQKTTVEIAVSATEGDVDQTFTIIPASIDLIWEAHTYTPPFFKGKPLFTAQSDITFIAVPHIMRGGSEVSPGNLVYKWSTNGTVLGDQGGYGKDSLNITSPFLPRPLDITVEATDPQTGSVADGEVVLTPGTPFILLYKNDPLYGVEYEHALQNNYSLTDQEIEIASVPYYFSANSSYDNSLTYNWEINGVPIADGQNSPDKVFRQVGDAYGTSNISLSVSDGQRMFQTANTSLLINFVKPTTQAAF